MGRILFLIALFYMISRATSRKKKKNSAAGQPPAAPAKEQAPSEGDTVYRDLFDEADAKEKAPAARHSRKTAKETVRSSLRQIDASVGHHNVEASSISGHTHQETSLTGVQENCEPEPRPVAVKPAAASKTSSPSKPSMPVLNPGTIREGVILAEILGKPKALKR